MLGVAQHHVLPAQQLRVTQLRRVVAEPQRAEPFQLREGYQVVLFGERLAHDQLGVAEGHDRRHDGRSMLVLVALCELQRLRFRPRWLAVPASEDTTSPRYSGRHFPCPVGLTMQATLCPCCCERLRAARHWRRPP